MLRPTAMSTLDYRTFTEHEPSLLTIPRPYNSAQTTYDHKQSQSALGSIGQFDSEGNRSDRSSKDTLHSQEIGDDIGPEMKVAGVSKFFKLLASSQPTIALGARPKQAATSMDSSTLAAGLRQPLQPAEIPPVTSANISSSAFSWPSSTHQPSLLMPRGESTSFRPPLMYTSEVLPRHTDETLRHTTHDAVAAQLLLTLGRPSSRASRTEEKRAYTHKQRSSQDSVHEWLTAVTTTGLLDQPPSIDESHVTSIGRERQSSLPMGADAALIQPVQSARSTRLTRRSSSSVSVVLAELVNFARGTTESMLSLYDRNRADAIAREQTLIQDANRREQEAARREQEAARRDELAHFEKQKMRDEAKARDELALSEKQKMRDEAKAREELVFREKEQLRIEACKRKEANLKREQSYMQVELKRKEIETAAATEIQKQQIEANFKMQARVGWGKTPRAGNTPPVKLAGFSIY